MRASQHSYTDLVGELALWAGLARQTKMESTFGLPSNAQDEVNLWLCPICAYTTTLSRSALSVDS